MNLYKVEIKYPKRPARFAYLHIQGINLLRAVELTTNIIKSKNMGEEVLVFDNHCGSYVFKMAEISSVKLIAKIDNPNE